MHAKSLRIFLTYHLEAFSYLEVSQFTSFRFKSYLVFPLAGGSCLFHSYVFESIDVKLALIFFQNQFICDVKLGKYTALFEKIAQNFSEVVMLKEFEDFI